MSKKHSLEEYVMRYPLIAVGITLFFLVLLGVVGWKVFGGFNNKEEVRQVAKVEFSDGTNSVVVERDGTVTIKTNSGTFVQKWDLDKVRKFFESLDSLDFEGLSSFIGGDLALKLTLGNTVYEISVDDERVSTAVDLLQEELEEAYQDNTTNDQSGNSVLPPNIGDQDGQLGIITKKPGETASGTTGSTGTVNDNPWETGTSLPDEEGMFTCEAFDPKIGRRVIISNTVCGN
jgi:hypothetical protein